MITDELITAVLADHARDVVVPPDLLPNALARSRRTARRGKAAGALAVGAAISLVASVLVVHVGRSSTAELPVSHGGPTAFPPFPFTPTKLPAGLGAPTTSLYGGTTSLDYLPTQKEPALSPEAGPLADSVGTTSQVVISVSTAPQALVGLSGPGSPTNVGGVPGRLYVRETHAAVVVTFQRDGLYVVVAGDRDYATTAIVRRVAGSLVDRPVAATPPFELRDLPQGITSLSTYSSSVATFEPASTDDPETHSAVGDGLEIVYSEAPPQDQGKSTPVEVGNDSGFRDDDGLYFQVGAGRYVQLLSKVISTAELVHVAEGLTVTPAAVPDVAVGFGTSG